VPAGRDDLQALENDGRLVMGEKKLQKKGDPISRE